MPLNNLYILNTRPQFAKAQERFKHLIESHGGKTYALPLQDIRENGVEYPNMQQFHKIIFVSQPAVFYFFKNLKTVLPRRTQMIAIGKATAQAIEQHQVKVDYYAPEASSEELLQADVFRDIQSQSILWVKGTHGRRVIGERLKERGAIVTELPVYQSCLIDYSPNVLNKIWETFGINMVLITSEQALHHLINICPPVWLAKKNLLCFSHRLADIAKPFIKGHILICRHDEIVKTLLAFKAKNEF